MSHPFFIIELKADFSLDDCVDFLNALTEKGEKVFRNLYVALPFFRLKEIITAFPDSGITFGSAMINNCDPDSFTASIAGKMVNDAGGKFTLIGTRYERNRLALTNEQLEYKLKTASDAGLKVIYAISGGEDALVDQLSALKKSEIQASLIFELDFKDFQHYLPSHEELIHEKKLIDEAVEKVFPGEKFPTLGALPSDLIGFSSLFDSLPFDGAFFIKSGAYPHAVHDEAVKLLHVHCEEEK